MIANQIDVWYEVHGEQFVEEVSRLQWVSDLPTHLAYLHAVHNEVDVSWEDIRITGITFTY